MRNKLIGCIADNSPRAQEAFDILSARYDLVDLHSKIQAVDLIIVLGGDGFMLHSLHSFMHLNAPIYGMNCGTIGFLMNQFDAGDLFERLETAKKTIIHPLKMTAYRHKMEPIKALAINEIHLFRKTNQAAKIRISVDNKTMIDQFIGDGLIVSTTAGSSAYNYSAGGPILPIGSNLLALTPISPFRPRRWRGALLPHNASFKFEILEYDKRQVNAVADFNEIQEVNTVEVTEDRSRVICLLFDPGHSLEERIILEQFF